MLEMSKVTVKLNHIEPILNVFSNALVHFLSVFVSDLFRLLTMLLPLSVESLLLVLVLLHVDVSFEHLLVQKRREEHLVELSWLLSFFLVVSSVFKNLLVRVKD
jgi:hypothetical protein